MRHYIVTYTVETCSLEHASTEADAIAYATTELIGRGKTVTVVGVQDVTKDYRRAVKA